MYRIFVMTVSSMKRFLRDKTALFFTLFFPIMFLVIFGFIFGNDDTQVSFNVALFDDAQTEFSKSFAEQGGVDTTFDFIDVEDYDDARDKLSRSEIDAIIRLPEGFGAGDPPGGELVIEYSQGDSEAAQTLVAVMNGIFSGINQGIDPYSPPFTVKSEPISVEGLDPFDYIASGLFGFSILSLAIFGMANGFASDKKTGSIARLQVAPIKAWHVVLSTGLTYIIIGLLSISLMVLVAVVLFDFNMVGDWFSFISFVVISTIVLFGLGLIVGGWAKNEQQAAPLANLISFPMMFLSGVFFPRFLMPDWLQDISQYLALTPVNEGLRLITSEGKTIFDLGPQLAVLGVWGIVSYLIAFKVFRWQ